MDANPDIRQNLENELRVAIDAVVVAARVCRSVQASITKDVLEKSDRSPVTVADYSSQAIICRAIGDVFPNDRIIAEEGSEALRQRENATVLDRAVSELARQSIHATGPEVCDWIDHGGHADYSDRFWTLDPIDGTKGFLRGEQYAISLALIINGQIQLAVLGCPNLKRSDDTKSSGAMFHAIRGHGSFEVSIDQPDIENARVTRVSDTKQWADARFCESVESGHSSHGKSAQIAETLGINQPPVRLDSQAKYAVVARGEADAYLRLPTSADYREKIWDHAGGVLIVEEAGGRVTDIFGRPLEFPYGRELTANRGVIVSNDRLHESLLSAIKSAEIQ